MSNTADILCEAVRLRKPVEFEYIKDDKVRGMRVGNPHAVFHDKDPQGIDNVYAHIVQTGGVSDTITEFPEWRRFFVDNMQSVKILQDEPAFAIQDGYNPHSSMYAWAVCKI
jgi:hypothetical protein